MHCRTPAKVALLGSLLLAAGCSSASGVASGPRSPGASEAATDEGEGPLRVRLYMMSRCPHCARAVATLAPLARELGDQMRLEVDYLGEEVEGELDSLHGEAEVLGDLIELCVHRTAPYERWLAFLECYHQRWREIPEGLDDCAEEAEVDDLAAVARCVEDGSGTEALRASFRRSAEAEISAAPTIVVGGITIVGAQDETSLSEVVCAQYDEATRPPMCELVDPLPYVPVTILTDARCDDPGCDVAEARRWIRDLAWGATFNELDVASEAGRAVYRSAGVKGLPVMLIGSEIMDDPQAYRQLRGMRRAGEYLVRTLGRFDPEAGRWMPRKAITAQVVTDSRCPSTLCRIERLEKAIAAELPSAEVARVDYHDQGAGRALYRKLAEASELPALLLPALFFSKTLTDDEELYGQLEPDLLDVDEGFLLPVGGWDPLAEICDNGEDDDDDDELADCADSDCADQMICRPEKARRLDLFAMSQCPFAAAVYSQMKTVVEHFGRDRDKIIFRVNYIGEVTEEGELRSMHGAEEVAEDTRQLCIQEHYGAGYAFVDYLDCRAPSFGSPDWEQCLRPPLEAAVIARCAEGDEGPRLLRESFELSERLGITGSPAWMVNNRERMSARTAAAIVEAYCERNELPECHVAVPESPLEATPEGGCGGQ